VHLFEDIVMVGIEGNWETLDVFLHKHVPCQGMSVGIILKAYTVVQYSITSSHNNYFVHKKPLHLG